jgi:hypothetical protein
LAVTAGIYVIELGSNAAFEPSSITSITITLEPFDRPFVASDTTRGITIGDVLTAVYKSARAGATRIFCELIIYLHVAFRKAENCYY